MSVRDIVLFEFDSVAGIVSFGLWPVRCLPMLRSAASSLSVSRLGSPSTPVDEEGDPPLRARWSAFDQELDSRARLQAYSGFCSTTQRHDAGLHFWTTCRDLPGLPLSKRSSSSTSHDDTRMPASDAGFNVISY
eukprot:s4639_g7.t2